MKKYVDKKDIHTDFKLDGNVLVELQSYK